MIFSNRTWITGYIIQLGFCIVVVAAVADGVDICRREMAFLTYFIFFGKDHFSGIVNKFKHRDFYREMKQKKIKVTKNKDKNDEG